jgi:DNA modification methylase
MFSTEFSFRKRKKYKSINNILIVDLRFGDTIEQMKLIPNKSIDCIICDLPYGTTSCKWDNIIPLEELWQQYKRIIKDNGAILLFASQPFTSFLVTSNINMFKYDFCWDKKKLSGMLNAKKQPLRSHEDILVFYKKLPTYNPQMRYDGKKTGIKKHIINSEVYRKTNKITNYVDDGSRYPTSLIKNINGVIGNSKEKLPHPTQKPILLLEYLILTYSNENDTILDNTFGTCTTGVACVNLDRNFIGIENNEYYFDISKNRLQEKRKEKQFKLIINKIIK